MCQQAVKESVWKMLLTRPAKTRDDRFQLELAGRNGHGQDVSHCQVDGLLIQIVFQDDESSVKLRGIGIQNGLKR